MADTDEKRIFIIAGPNGAGKTTFATEFLPNEANCPFFINTDLIAAGLNPFRPDRVGAQAGRLVLNQIRENALRGESFAFETTLSGRGYARHIPRWREQGYRVKLFFLQLPTPEMAIARVTQRVLEGGHDVPEEVIRRRFDAGRRNFEKIYRDLVDGWALYDNSGEVPELLEEQVRV
ncbi:MAG: zeta toxin family protein [Nitrospinae bacterium]|nr:zeta toxin family protein [Nitrospinota bacterium]